MKKAAKKSKKVPKRTFEAQLKRAFSKISVLNQDVHMLEWEMANKQLKEHHALFERINLLENIVTEIEKRLNGMAL